MLKNPFYLGQFYWEDTLYKGTQEPLIDRSLFEQAQAVFAGHNRPKYRKNDFPFGGILTCAHDGCTVTAEMKKGKYTYYHCTGFRGKCGLPYFREEELGNRLGQVLKDIHIPDAVLKKLVEALNSDSGKCEQARDEQRDRLKERLADVQRRIDQAYTDKLDGKIPEDFWERKSAEWRKEEVEIAHAIQCYDGHSKQHHVMDAIRTLELANRAYLLYVQQPPAEKAKLLKTVLSNCGIDRLNLYPTYRKPFDLIFKRAEAKEWYAR